jgi:hypothetical protein
MLAAAILGLTVAALASQVHPEPVELEEILSAHTVVAVVEPADPPRRTVEDGVVHGEACPYGVARFVVRDRVQVPDGLLTVGEVIEVASSDFELYCAMQQAYERGEPVPSPIIPEYHGERRSPEAGPRIVYLSASGSGPWRFVVDNAWDPVADLEAVKARLVALQPTPAPAVAE